MAKTPKRIVFTAAPQLRVTFRNVPAAADKAEKKIATLGGYAIVWNQLSKDRGGYQVRLLPNSAQACPDGVLALFHHNYCQLIGNTANGTLRLVPDAKGVRVEIDLPDTMCGRDCEELVEGKYVNGMSFAMVEVLEGIEKVENGVSIFEVSKFTYDEVTVTPVPAFIGTSIEVSEDDEPEDAEAGKMSAAKNKSALEKDLNAHRLKLDMYAHDQRRL